MSSLHKPRCLDCSHLVDYHRGPQCRGVTRYPVGGVARPDEDRCTCRHGPDEAPQAASPVCPFCDNQPYAMVSHSQWACGNDNCPCLMWNPALTREENRRTAQTTNWTGGDR